MPTVLLTQALREEYERLFNACVIRPERAGDIDAMTRRVLAGRPRYESLGGVVGIPWFFIGLIHAMEASLNFEAHLHNGDPLTARTRQVPSGRPRTGMPPFTWEESARDALSMRSLGSRIDWSLAGLLYQMERYNGFGYRLHHAQILTPYLWAGSMHYTSGKYVADGTWSDTAVSKQSGAAAILRRLAETGAVSFPAPPGA
jgi:lysozyme family protein